MSQVEGFVDDTFAINECEDNEYINWLKMHNLTKFYVPMKECLAIDCIESCKDLEMDDIPRICQNIPDCMKKQHQIAFKDEVILKKQLKVLIRQRAQNSNNNKKRKDNDKAPNKVQQHDRVVHIRNPTEQESNYLEKLNQAQDELKLLLNTRIRNQEKESKQCYDNALTNLKAAFDEFHSQLTDVYQKNCARIQNIYQSNDSLKQDKFRHDLNQVLREIENVKMQCIKSLQYDSMDSYMRQRNKINEISGKNTSQMNRTINKAKKLGVVNKNKQEQEKKLWSNVESFLQTSKSEMTVCVNKYLTFNEQQCQQV